MSSQRSNESRDWSDVMSVAEIRCRSKATSLSSATGTSPSSTSDMYTVTINTKLYECCYISLFNYKNDIYTELIIHDLNADFTEVQNNGIRYDMHLVIVLANYFRIKHVHFYMINLIIKKNIYTQSTNISRLWSYSKISFQIYSSIF